MEKGREGGERKERGGDEERGQGKGEGVLTIIHLSVTPLWATSEDGNRKTTPLLSDGGLCDVREIPVVGKGKSLSKTETPSSGLITFPNRQDRGPSGIPSSESLEFNTP